MLAASFCREVHFTVLSSTTMASRVPRCLFGPPNPRESVEMLHEALEAERTKFARRWGVDPRASSEDKENHCQRKQPHEKHHHEQHTPKKRSNPYARQTSIHEYWRARKVCEVNKKPLAVVSDSVANQQNAETSKYTKSESSKLTKSPKSAKKASSN